MSKFNDKFNEMIFPLADIISRQIVPGGVAIDHTGLAWTNDAFDFYIAHHGLPTTANETRQMFEYAAVLDTVANEVEQRLGLA